MGFLNSLNVSASALTANKLRMDVIADNLANAETTRTADGTPYRRKTVVLEEKASAFSGILNNAMEKASGTGVRVSEISEDQSALKLVYNPNHPDADANGYVSMPNVDTAEEMVDMISATRSYEANITALNAAKSMAMKALEIGR